MYTGDLYSNAKPTWAHAWNHIYVTQHFWEIAIS